MSFDQYYLKYGATLDTIESKFRLHQRLRLYSLPASDGLGTFGLPNVTQEEDNLTVDDIEFIRDFILKHCKDTF